VAPQRCVKVYKYCWLLHFPPPRKEALHRLSPPGPPHHARRTRGRSVIEKKSTTRGKFTFFPRGSAVPAAERSRLRVRGFVDAVADGRRLFEALRELLAPDERAAE